MRRAKHTLEQRLRHPATRLATVETKPFSCAAAWKANAPLVLPLLHANGEHAQQHIERRQKMSQGRGRRGAPDAATCIGN